MSLDKKRPIKGSCHWTRRDQLRCHAIGGEETNVLHPVMFSTKDGSQTHYNMIVEDIYTQYKIYTHTYFRKHSDIPPTKIRNMGILVLLVRCRFLDTEMIASTLGSTNMLYP